MQFDESHLVSLARSGDLDAFGQLYRRHAPGVYNLVLRILGNPDDAEDVKQEVFLRAHRSLDSFRGNARFSTWIYRIATNLSLDELRKRKPVVSVDQLSSDSSWEPVSENTEADPERLLQRKAARDAVQAALMAMPPHYRILVALDRQDVLAYGMPEPLRPGMLLEADILGERRKLHEWLLEPLYSLRGRDGVAAAGR